MLYSLYLISAITDGILQWKIGLSKHPNKRITELKTANPNIQQIDALYGIKNRQIAGQLSGAAAREGQARADSTSALTGMIGGIASAAGSFMSATGAASAPAAVK